MDSLNLKTEERGLSVEFVQECFEYDGANLIWKTRPIAHFASKKSWMRWNTLYAGNVCGGANSKKPTEAYLRVGLKIEGKVRLFLAHRIVWALHYGYFPSKFVDHIDGDVTNNSISNLRDVSNKVNCRNSRLYSHNTSGVSGVSWWSKENCWIVSGGGHSSGTFEYLGTYKDFFEAVCVRKSWQAKRNYSETHGRYKDSKLPQFPVGLGLGSVMKKESLQYEQEEHCM